MDETPSIPAEQLRRARLRERMLIAGPLGGRETAVAGCLLAVVGLLLALPHIRHGSFYQDDWGILSVVHFPAIAHAGLIHQLWLYYSKRPGEVIYYAALETVLGFHVHLQLLLAAVLVCIDALCLFALLRMLRFEPLHAGLVALLALLFPFSDSLWLWPILTMATLTTALYLIGVMVALRAFDATDRRRALALHAVSFSLYIVGILSYEVFGALGCLVGLLYLPRVGFARARVRWAIDVAGILVTLAVAKVALPADFATPTRTLTLSGMVTHAHLIVHQGLQVIAAAAEPLGRPGTAVILLAGGALALAAMVAIVRLAPGDPARASLHRWLGVSLAGAVIAGGAWAIYMPAITYYSPGALGTGNRVNALAGPGVVLIVFGATMVLATLLSLVPRRGAAGRSGAGATAIGVVLCALIAVGYARRDHRDIGYWDSAARVQRTILASLHAQIPRLPNGATVFVIDRPRVAEGWMPAFARSWDLSGAMRWSYDERRVAGIPINAHSTFSCSQHAIYPTNEGYSRANRAYFGHAFALDVLRGRSVAITDRPSCLRVSAAVAGGHLS